MYLYHTIRPCCLDWISVSQAMRIFLLWFFFFTFTFIDNNLLDVCLQLGRAVLYTSWCWDLERCQHPPPTERNSSDHCHAAHLITSFCVVPNSEWGSLDYSSRADFLWPLKDREHFVCATYQNLNPGCSSGFHMPLGSNAVIPQRNRSCRDLGWRKGWIV